MLVNASSPEFLFSGNNRGKSVGFGSNLTMEGTVECDASIMGGSMAQDFGAVGAVSGR